MRAIAVLEKEASSATYPMTFLEAVASGGGMDPGNPAVLTLSQAVVELPHRVAYDLSGIDGDQATYAKRGVDALIGTLSAKNLLTPWAELYSTIDSVGLPGLTICSMLLDQHAAEKSIDEDELNRIAEDAKELLDHVRLNESLPADVL